MRSTVAILGALALLHTATAAIPDVFDEVSGQYAGAAREMVDSGRWVVPTLAGVPRLQKPPLVYWLTAASLRLAGSNEAGARLPAALAIVGLVVVTWRLAVRLVPEAPLAAPAVLGTSLGTALLGKLIMPEPFLALGIAAALLAVVRLVEDPGRRHRWALAAWGASALASFAKGLHGLLLPATTVLALAALRPEVRPALRELLAWRGPALFVGVLAPWYVRVELDFPGFLVDHFVNEQVGHVLDTHVPRDSEPTPLAVFWAQHLVWWFPWAVFAPAAVLARRAPTAHPLRTLPHVWLTVTALAVSLAGQRQDYYTMAAWPAFALLVARAWAAPRVRCAALAAALAMLVLLGGLGLAAWALGPATLLAEDGMSAPFGERNSLAGALRGLAPGEWRRLWWLLAPAAGATVAAAVGGLGLLERAPRWSWAPVATGAAAVALSAMAGLQLLAPSFGLKAIGQALEGRRGASSLVVFDGPSHRGSSLAFYTRAPVRWLADPKAEFAVRARGVGRDRFVTEAEVVARWRAGETVHLIVEEVRAPHWRVRIGEWVVVARSGTRVLATRPLGAR